MPISDRYLGLESLIVTRLEQQLALLRPLPRVLVTGALSVMKEADQPIPAVHVLLNNSNPRSETAAGQKIMVDQQWLVYVVVRELRKGQYLTEAADILIVKVLQSLQAWQPPGGYARFKWLKSGVKPLASNGFMYYPLLFESSFVFDIGEG